MAQEKTANPKTTKPRKSIEEKLTVALANFKPALGEKKFKKRIKKASRLIASGITNDSAKNGTGKTQSTSKTVKQKKVSN